MALVSIIMPCYNSSEFVEDSIDSVVGQTFADWEIIAINDGSTDTTEALLRSKASLVGSRMHVLNQHNRGAAAARNAGLSRASGRFAAFIDSDDLWHPQKLQLQLEYLENHPELRGVTTSYQFLDLARDRKSGIRTFNWSFEELEDWILLGRSAPALCSTLIVEKSLIEEAGGFDELLGSFGEDPDLAWRLRNAGSLGSLVEGLVLIRRSPNQGHTNTLGMAQSLRRFHSKNLESCPRLFLRASRNLNVYLRLRSSREERGWWGAMSRALSDPVASFQFLIFRVRSLVAGLIRDTLRRETAN